MRNRADIPIEVFYWTWAAMFIHAALRSTRRAWIEQLGLTGVLCLGSPLLGGFGWRNLISFDAVRAGMDATLVGLGILFLVAAWKLSRRPPVQTKTLAAVEADLVDA